MQFKFRIILVFLLSNLCIVAQAQTIQYTMPDEWSAHEGTWLQWPHNHTYGPYYRDDLEPTWIAMTEALIDGEKVHIIAYNQTEKNHIIDVLFDEGVSMSNIDFFIHENDDCWVRDNGPLFVYDLSHNLKILDWGFNGWGFETAYEKDDLIPALVSTDIAVANIDLGAMVLEGGAIELDGNGSLMATKSSIINENRNPELTQIEIENYLTTYLGTTNFIWLDGVAGLDITDMHIDGFARFMDSSTIVTMDSLDLIYWDVPSNDITTLYQANNIDNQPYNYIFLPLTQNNVVTTWDENLGYKGAYINYYVGNTCVLVPTYNDANDAIAMSILQDIYTTREVIGIDVRNLYYGGGMVHCVAQQQPVDISGQGIFDQNNFKKNNFQNNPNPFNKTTSIAFYLEQSADVKLEVYNAIGIKIATAVNDFFAQGKHQLTLNAEDFEAGYYSYIITINDEATLAKMIVLK